MRSTAAEDAGTDKYFFANLAKVGKTASYCFQKHNGSVDRCSLANRQYSSIATVVWDVTNSVISADGEV